VDFFYDPGVRVISFLLIIKRTLAPFVLDAGTTCDAFFIINQIAMNSTFLVNRISDDSLNNI